MRVYPPCRAMKGRRDVPVQVRGDPLWLRQVLLNVIGNAIKFTDRGEVSTAVRVHKETNQQVTLLFSVADMGIGILPEKSEHIFDSFTQADVSTIRRYGGTGLGLTVSRRSCIKLRARQEHRQ